MPDTPLQGKVAIVTGPAGGIGSAYARGLAEAGAAVALADINGDAAAAGAAALAADGHRSVGVQVDVSSEDSANAMAVTVAEQLGGIDTSW
jgi:NAD(P)-dependent dehydrogenase (short-subunit alcohol dehydrogenase family)